MRLFSPFLPATMRTVKVSNIGSRDITGVRIKEIYNSDNENREGNTLIHDSLEKAIATRNTVKLAAVRYDIPNGDTGETEPTWWQAQYIPITGANGEIAYLMCTTRNITEQMVAQEAMQMAEEHKAALQREKALTEKLLVANDELHLSRQKLSSLNNELEARVASRTKALMLSEDNFRNIILQAPVAVGFFSGENMVLEVINDKFLELWDKPRSIIGKPLLDALPELRGQPYLEIMQNVLRKGETYYGNQSKVLLKRNGVLSEGYYNFINHPFKDAEGNNTGIIVVAHEVTDQVIALEKQQLLNDKLAAINAKLETSNEELTATNEELADAQIALEHFVKELKESENRFRTLVQQAPVAICIFKGRELVIETANDTMQKMLGKKDLVGKTFAAAVPELDGQPFFNLLDNVFITGNTYYAAEDRALIEHNGKITEGYFNFVYQPIKDKSGITTSVMTVATEVTEQVIARKQVERAEQLLRMATESADLGTWYLDAKSREFVASPKLKEIFGFYPDEHMPYEAAISQIHPDYRDKVTAAVEASIDDGIKFDMEYPLVGFHDGKLHWVKAVGNFNPNSDGTAGNFAGVLREITEQKLDEIRKNDFIAMVSHELKTPLTSLKAYVQLTLALINKNNDARAANILQKANSQVNKMTGMINSFLNVARLEAGKIQLEKKRFVLNELITETIEEMTSAMQVNHIRVLPCEPISVYADYEKIGQVINNLLTNAIKYSPADKPIEVACSEVNNTVQISVKDEGIGILPEHQAKLFERFYRVEDDQNKTVSGFGIGLYLSAEIVHRHNGNIWVESELNKGSVFYVSLPLEQ